MGTAEFVNVDSDKKARFGKGLVSAEGLRVGAGVGKAVKLMRLLKKINNVNSCIQFRCVVGAARRGGNGGVACAPPCLCVCPL